jgi:hypothetical protein
MEFGLFQPFLYKIGQNLAEALSGHSTFILPFMSYAAEHSISQLATLLLDEVR